MGIDNNIYLGPYLKVKRVDKEISKEVITCSNIECIHYDEEFFIQDNFCKRCGSPIKERIKTSLVKAGFMRWINSSNDDENISYLNDVVFNHAASKSKVEIVMSNKNTINGRELHFDETYDSDVDAMKVDKLEERITFTREHQKAIDSMKEYFGGENISMHWGMVIYQS